MQKRSASSSVGAGARFPAISVPVFRANFGYVYDNEKRKESAKK